MCLLWFGKRKFELISMCPNVSIVVQKKEDLN